MECQVSRAMCFLLGVSRVFGIAPLRVRRTPHGCTASLSPTWTIYGFVSLILSGGASVNILIQMVIQQGLRSLITVAMMLRILNFLIVLYVATVGTITASKRMKRLIRNTNRLEQIHTAIDHDMLSDGIWWRAWAPIPYTILGTVVISLNLVSIKNKKLKDEQDRATATVILYTWFLCVLTLLKYHLSFMMMAIYNTLKALNHSVTMYMSTVKDPSRLSIKTIKDYGVQYCSVCDIIFDVNAKESSLYFAIFAQHFLNTTFTIYLLGTSMKEGKMTAIILQMLWILYNLSGVIIVIEACHYIKSEVEKAKAIICNISCAESADKQLLRESGDILQQLSLVKHIFSPLGVFSLTRSFIVTVRVIDKAL